MPEPPPRRALEKAATLLSDQEPASVLAHASNSKRRTKPCQRHHGESSSSQCIASADTQVQTNATIPTSFAVEACSVTRGNVLSTDPNLRPAVPSRKPLLACQTKSRHPFPHSPLSFVGRTSARRKAVSYPREPKHRK